MSWWCHHWWHTTLNKLKGLRKRVSGFSSSSSWTISCSWGFLLPTWRLALRRCFFFSSNSHLLLPLHSSTSSATPWSPDQPPHPSPHPLPARAFLSVANRQKEGALQEEAQQVHLNKRFLHNGWWLGIFWVLTLALLDVLNLNVLQRSNDKNWGSSEWWQPSDILGDIRAEYLVGLGGQKWIEWEIEGGNKSKARGER